VSVVSSFGTVIAVTGLAFEASIAAGTGITVIRGNDPRRLKASLESAVTRATRGIISFGIAGGLAPDLAPGHWVVPTAVIIGGRRVLTCPIWSRKLMDMMPGARGGEITGVDAPVANPMDKRALYRGTGAAAVDMESHVAADVAYAFGVPFAAFRIIIDPVHRALPPAALVELRPDGRPDVPEVLRSVVWRPGQLPALMRTALDAQKARSALLRSRRLLGPHLGFPDSSKHLFDMPREDVFSVPLPVERNFRHHIPLGSYAAQTDG
jgi:adenosylhomocysteine nucleosidase